MLFSQTAKQHQLAQKSHHRLLEVKTLNMNQKVKTCNWICLKWIFFKALQYLMYFLEKVSFLQCALRMDSSGQNSIFKRQNRELDPFWPWWLVPAINRTARHTSQANMGSRDIHKLVLVIYF